MKLVILPQPENPINMSNKHILVAFGGPSPEHEVSVLTAMQAMAALADTGHTLIPLYITKSGQWLTGDQLKNLESYQNLKSLATSAIPCTFSIQANGKTVITEIGRSGIFSKPRTWNVDVVIPAFHGSDGENGSFQGVCETFNLPYSGSGVLGSAAGMNKAMAKALCRALGYPVVPDVHFFESDWVANRGHLTRQIESLGYPVFVKPVNLGSSIGVARCVNRNELLANVETAFRYDTHILVEKGVQPLMEINCSVMGTPEKAEPSVLEHPVGSGELLSFADKYQRGESTKGMASADRIIPAPISSEQTREIQQLAVAIFRSLECSGLARLDFLMNADTGQVYFNEINTIPGSFSFYLWDHSDVSFGALLQRLIDIAIGRHQQKNGRVRSYETNLLSQKAARGLKGLKGVKGSKNRR
jgi:D-alanine-D-alanine ligase